MTWILAMLVALAAFAVAVAVFRLPRITWTSLAAALVLGLAGYTLQASPDVPSAPSAKMQDAYQDEWQVMEARRILTGDRGRADHLLTADAFATRGRFSEAAGFLDNVLRDNPEDFEAWVALGNVLTEQADGVLTQASVYAYRQANELRPDNPAPGYFLGLSLLRQGRLMEARGAWRGALQAMEPDPGDEAFRFLAERVSRLEEMLVQAGAIQPEEETTADAAPQ